MVRVGNAIRHRQNADAAIDRETVALKRVTDWREFKFEWHDRQTDKAVRFPTYGWLPRTAIAWRRGETILPWSLGNEADQFLIAGWIVEQKGLRP